MPAPPQADPLRIEADYLIETAFDPAQAAETMAAEQSSGTFIAVPGETPELKTRFAARVERLEVVDEMPHRPCRGLAALLKAHRAVPRFGDARTSRCPGRWKRLGHRCQT